MAAMRIGFSKVDITPPIGTELGGYAGYRPSSGVHDPLHCRAVLLEQDSLLYALVSLELTARVKQLRVDFFPAIESCLYRNYKQLDERLIRQIPFILTGERSAHRGRGGSGRYRKHFLLSQRKQPMSPDPLTLPISTCPRSFWN